MAILKTKTLDNGVDINYSIIGNLNIIPNESIEVELHGFTSETYYTKSLKRNSLLNEQQQLVEKLNKLTSKDLYDSNKASLISNKINELAKLIKELNTYEDYLIGKLNLKIPYIEDYTIENVENELLKLNIFN